MLTIGYKNLPPEVDHIGFLSAFAVNVDEINVHVTMINKALVALAVGSPSYFLF